MKSDYFKEFWRYRELFFFFIWRDVKVRYKQTLLGVSWAIIQPFCTMVVFSLFFGRLAKIPSDGIPYPIFSYSALLPWTYFSNSLSYGGNALVSNAHLITKVYFPRVCLPTSAVLGGLVDFGIASSVLLLMMVYYGIPISWELLCWPLLMVPLVMITMSIVFVLSALNVRYRDIRYTIPFITQLWLFVTPVIYPTSIIPERFQFLSFLNPVSAIIESFRAALLPEKYIDWSALGVSVAIISLLLIVCVRFFCNEEKKLADIV